MIRLITVLAVAMLILLTASSHADEKPHPGKDLSVALLSPGPISDAGWNASGYEGLLAIEKELKASISQVETKTPAEFEESFRTFGDRGYRVIFGHGFEFQDTAEELREEFPNTIFVITNGQEVFGDNVVPLKLYLEEPSYLCGVLAGMLSRTGVAGCVGGMDFPAIRWCFSGFRDGFLSVRPKGKVLEAFINSWEDVGAAREAAMAQIAQGADFLIHNADAASTGVFLAARETRSRKVYAFGTNKDQNHVMPQTILASAVLDIPKAMLGLAREVAAGQFKPRAVTLTLKTGTASLVINPELAYVIPPAVMKKVEEASEAIRAGKLRFPSVKR